MSGDQPPWPGTDTSTKLVHWLIAAACVATIGLTVMIAGAKAMNAPARSLDDSVDYEFSGDTAMLRGLPVPRGWQEVTDRPRCTESEPNVRCFTTRLDRSAVMKYLHASVGVAAHDNHDGRLQPGWTACGDLLGAPAVAQVSRDIVNAVRTGPGSWRIPSSGPVLGERLVVSITLFNAPECA